MTATNALTPSARMPTARGRYRFRADIAIADAAFDAWGATIEELFLAAADATVHTMADHPEAIERRKSRSIRLEEERADLLLFRFLGELVYHKDAEGLLLRVASVRVRSHGDALFLEAEARGETLDPLRHGLRADVKAVTLHRLRVERTALGWEATVVLDI
jgi:SHS2 domain-containing protein